MKKSLPYLFLTSLLLGLPLPTYAETLTLTSYYPSPFGVYDRIQLYPRPHIPEETCDSGTMYYDSDNKKFQFCRDGLWGGADGVWTQDGDNIFPTDTDTNPALKVGIGTKTPAFMLTLDDQDGGGILAIGQHNQGPTLPDLSTGTRFIWYPQKNAIRAGRAVGDKWNHDKIGDSSTSFGWDTEASGNYSVALGQGATASDQGAFAVGRNPTASAPDSFAFGNGVNATANSSFAFGRGNTTASQPDAFAFGNNVHALNNNAFAFGNAGTTASGPHSFAFGRTAQATGNDAFAIGYNTTASGNYSVAIGKSTTAGPGKNTFVFGEGLTVSGNYSVGFALDSETGVDLINANTMAIVGGNVGIGTTFPTETLDVTGYINATDGFKLNGTCFPGSCPSDKKLKRDIQPLSNSLEKISQLQPVQFQFIDNKYGSGQQIGLIAQDVEKIIPEWVSDGGDGYKHINYGLQTEMYLIEAVKELKTENDTLKARIEALEKSVK